MGVRLCPTAPQEIGRGYIAVAAELNDRNEDFRKAVKLAKGWRAACKAHEPGFPLKSFHLEQAITAWVTANPEVDLFDMLFAFFTRLNDYMRYPQFLDRADAGKNIDEYVTALSDADRKLVLEARDAFLIALEEFEEGDSVDSLINAGRKKRASSGEAYLFDQKIPMLTKSEFSIVGEVLPREGGFRSFILDRLGRIQVDRKIRFRLGSDAPAADMYKWKVKNDDNAREPRGEITDHHTRNDPEHTKYTGHHYVECFAVRDGICVARSRQNVVLEW